MDADIFANPKNVKFRDLLWFCRKYFRQRSKSGGSHFFFKTGIRGDPVINIQEGNDGMAKPYQVRAVEKAYRRLQELRSMEGESAPEEEQRE